MDYALTGDEAALVDAVQGIVRDHGEPPPEARQTFAYFDAPLQDALTAGGFLDAARTMSPLAAALVIMEAAAAPGALEVGASALIAPHLFDGEDAPPGPYALLSADAIGKAHRNLLIANTALIEDGEDVLVLSVDRASIDAVESIYAYPYARFLQPPDLRAARRLTGAAGPMLQWRRVALAGEMAGAAARAVTFTIDYVKTRHVFGKPVGAFQSVQHRLAQCHQAALAMRYLTLKAAWEGDAYHAALAACFAQQKVNKIVFDLHQFNGAMGVTSAHLLHFWTYRLRALQAEAGGVYGSARDVAHALWGARNDDGGGHDAHV